MAVFARGYDKVIQWAGHRHAPYYLAGLSFAEASFFPIPPDTLLVPMALAQRQRAWRYASLTTVMSVLGGLMGYCIGYFALALVMPWLQRLGYGEAYLQVRTWFEHWGFWAMLVAGFSPIPYKLFTIAAGAVSMPLLPFTVASLLGRGGRFFLVAGLIRWGGEPLAQGMRGIIDKLGWLVVAILVGLYGYHALG